MITRRSFIKQTSVASAALMIKPDFLNYDHSYIGLQLYTVRDAMQKDPAATLAKVAQIGYNSVEVTYSGPGNFYGMDAKSFADLVKKNGLIMPSAHYRLGEDKNTDGSDMKGTVLHDWDKAVDDAKTAGVKY